MAFVSFGGYDYALGVFGRVLGGKKAQEWHFSGWRVICFCLLRVLGSGLGWFWVLFFGFRWFFGILYHFLLDGRFVWRYICT